VGVEDVGLAAAESWGFGFAFGADEGAFGWLLRRSFNKMRENLADPRRAESRRPMRDETNAIFERHWPMDRGESVDERKSLEKRLLRL